MKKTYSVLLLILFFRIDSSVRASEQMRPANTLESGRIAVSVYGVHAEQNDLEFRLSGADLVQVPLKGGGTAQFFAGGNTDLRYDGESDSTVFRLTWRPSDGLHYGLKLGIGDYELRVPSGTVVNQLETEKKGILWGVDAAWTLLSDTPVTPAVMLMLGYARSDYPMTRLRTAGQTPAPIMKRFALEEWQGAVSASNRWRFFEPYIGLRFFRQTGTLRDLATAERVRGDRDGFSPYAGARLEFFPRESLIFEVSGVDETVVSAGLAIGF